jgi:hypothetical protein
VRGVLLFMREILFKLLDEIEPNELLKVSFRAGYGSIYLANKQSTLPLATEMTLLRERSSLEEAYREYDDYDYEYEDNFLDNHKIQLDNKNYLICEELLDIEYFDDYFSVTVSTPGGIDTIYHKYDDIITIRRNRKSGQDYLQKYNKLLYQYHKNNNK